MTKTGFLRTIAIRDNKRPAPCVARYMLDID
jgi:hypothetical protein